MGSRAPADLCQGAIGNRSMLCELVVDNLVIVSHARLCPERGLTVISGETGAGKSLLLDALALLLGQRAQGALVGPLREEATVSAVFALDGDHVATVGSACPVAILDGELIIRRRLTQGGRSQAWINDVPVTVATLRTVADLVIEIHAQHEALRLADRGRQLVLLDRFAGSAELAGDYRTSHQACLDLSRQLTDIEGGARESLRELDYLRFQREEIVALSPRPGELAGLELRQTALEDADRWRGLAAEVAECLVEGERALPRILGGLARRLAEAPDGDLAEAARTCQRTAEELREAGMACLRAQERLVADPAELARIGERIDAWYLLMRKHGEGEAAVLSAWETIDARILALEGLDQRRDRIAQDLAAERAHRAELGDALSRHRAQGFDALATGISRHLADLGMPRVRLSLDQRPLDEAGPDGTVHQEIFIQTNPGMPAGSLAQVPSGGESARISLALAMVFAEHDRCPVLVFDEVDSGVGGRLGAVIGEKLADLARDRTVIAVTHTPQVAAAAGRQYVVRKHQDDRQTTVTVEEVSGESRTREIAEMLGGGKAALGQARALLVGGSR